MKRRIRRDKKTARKGVKSYSGSFLSLFCDWSLLVTVLFFFLLVFAGCQSELFFKALGEIFR